jgi:hypothetical protein
VISTGDGFASAKRGRGRLVIFTTYWLKSDSTQLL